MKFAESLVTYFFLTLMLAVVVTNGAQVSSIVKSTAEGANAVSSGILGAKRG